MKRYKPEEIVALLRQIEVGIANGKSISSGLHLFFGASDRPPQVNSLSFHLVQKTLVTSRLLDQRVGIHRLACTRNGLEIQCVSSNLDEHKGTIRIETLDHLG